jgi:hypothetical protein
MASWRLRTKIAGSGAGSGSIGQRRGSGTVPTCHGSTTPVSLHEINSLFHGLEQLIKRVPAFCTSVMILELFTTFLLLKIGYKRLASKRCPINPVNIFKAEDLKRLL